MSHSTMPGALTHRLMIATAGVGLPAVLHIPAGAMGAVIVVRHGAAPATPDDDVTGSLEAACFGTLEVDLLTAAEASVDAQTGQLSLDVDLLANRLVGIVDWLRGQSATQALPVGVLASNSAAAAALVAAEVRSDRVRAVVARGGRPDRADEVLWSVHAPTLLIVGRRDLLAVARNRYALERMTCVRKLVLLEGIGHAFEGGAPEEAARLAASWFSEHLNAKAAALVGAAALDEDDCC